MTMTVFPERVRGVTKWVLCRAENGKRRRQFFDSEREAVKARDAASKEVALCGRWWARLTDIEQLEIAAVVEEIRRAGVALRTVWSAFQKGETKQPAGPLTIKAAIYQMLDDKKFANCNERYRDSLEGFLVRFAKGRESMRVADVSANDLKAWLSGIKNIDSRKTWRARLSSLFGWCVRRKFLAANPLEELEPIRNDKKGAPSILELDQVKAGFEYAVKHPRFLRWFTLGVMVGLRPEEADKVGQEMVRGDWESLSLPASASTKLRKPRIIEIPEPARIWLRLAGQVQPMSLATRRRHQRRLRQKWGLERWPKDVLRHTAASYLLARTQDIGLVARMLGNSPAVLNRHYLNPRTKAESDAFWALDGSAKVFQNGPHVKPKKSAA